MSCRAASNGFGISASWRIGSARPSWQCVGHYSRSRPLPHLQCALTLNCLQHRPPPEQYVRPASAGRCPGWKRSTPSQRWGLRTGSLRAGIPHKRIGRWTDNLPCSRGHQAGRRPCTGRRTPLGRSGAGPSPLGRPGQPLCGVGLSGMSSVGGPRAPGSRHRQSDNALRAASNLHSRQAPFKPCYPKCSGPGMSPPRGSLT